MQETLNHTLTQNPKDREKEWERGSIRPRVALRLPIIAFGSYRGTCRGGTNQSTRAAHERSQQRERAQQQQQQQLPCLGSHAPIGIMQLRSLPSLSQYQSSHKHAAVSVALADHAPHFQLEQPLSVRSLTHSLARPLSFCFVYKFALERRRSRA